MHPCVLSDNMTASLASRIKDIAFVSPLRNTFYKQLHEVRSPVLIFPDYVDTGLAHYSPDLLERFNRRKRAEIGRWYMDETYIRVRGQ